IFRRSSTALWGEFNRKLARFLYGEIRRLILIAKRMTADDDRLIPTLHIARYITADNRLAENRAIQNIADSAVGRLPHLFEVELFHTRFIRCNSGAFYPHTVLLDGIGRFNRDFILSFVAVFDRQIKIF